MMTDLLPSSFYAVSLMVEYKVPGGYLVTTAWLALCPDCRKPLERCTCYV